MKVFEEWWLMEGQNIVGHYDQQERYLASDVWVAALEWVLKNSETTGLCNHPVCTNTINTIKKELKCL